jgi:hypothetical protein
MQMNFKNNELVTRHNYFVRSCYFFIIIGLSGCLEQPLGDINKIIYDDDLVGVWVSEKSDHSSVCKIYRHIGLDAGIHDKKNIMAYRTVSHCSTVTGEVVDGSSDTFFVSDIDGDRYINMDFRKKADTQSYYIAIKYSLDENGKALKLCMPNIVKIQKLIESGKIIGTIQGKNTVLISETSEELRKKLKQYASLNVFDQCETLSRVDVRK